MADFQLSCSGRLLVSAELHVGRKGPWYVDLEFADDAPEAVGAATLQVGDTALSGTLIADRSGTFGLQRRTRLVAGGGAWGRVLSRRAYRNDAGVKASDVAQDAAKEAGEALTGVLPIAKLGASYIRNVAPASRTLENAAGMLPWYVGFDGLTRIAARATADVAAGSVRVLQYDAKRRVATLDIDSLSAVGIGSRISEGLSVPIVVGSLVVDIKPSGMRAHAYVGDEDSSRLADAMRAIIERASDTPLFGSYRYRVAGMNGERVDLQAVNSKISGLPDLIRADMWAGVAGAHASLTSGSECVVIFLDGDRGQPVISQFCGRAGPDPASLALCGSALQVARMGDLVSSGGAGTSIIIGLVGTGVPPNQAVVAGVPYPVSFALDPLEVGPLAKPLFGAIVTGSPKVSTGA